VKNKTKDELIVIIDTQSTLIESLCGEIHEAKARVHILETILHSYIPDLGADPD
tara:strand:+ start:5927 stop:6088 length:162 start_codon:yes stop_codon:yes gene_type:complete